MDVDASVPEQETSNAQGHAEQKGTALQQQLQFSCIIARSPHVLQRCLQHGSQHEQSPRHPTQMDLGTTAAPAENSDAAAVAQAENRKPGKAMHHLQSRQTGAAGGTGAVQPCRDAGASCMVRMSLHTVGPGVLHEGAAILCLGAEEASGIRHSHAAPQAEGLLSSQIRLPSSLRHNLVATDFSPGCDHTGVFAT